MPAAGARATFVGRADEMEKLRQALEDTAAGRPAVAVISGESGVGKTRLVTEFVVSARQRGATVLLGRCADFGDNGPSYWPILDALRGMWRQVGMEEPTTVLAEVSASPAVPSAAPPTPGSGPLFELVLRALQALAETAPVVLVLEDVHWADRSTQDLLTFLLASLTHGRVMTVITYRSEALGLGHPLQLLLAELRRNRRAMFLPLRRFTRPELVDLVHGLLGRSPDEELVELTWSRSEGNAFFAEELVEATVLGYGEELPPTLQHILMCRLEGVSEPTRGVLRLVAVAADGVAYPLLAAVSKLRDADLVAALREAVEQHLLRVAEDGQTYVFWHGLMQEVLYDDLLPGERQLFHAAFGRALARETGPSGVVATMLARHWYAAGNAARAIEASVEAAAAAAAIYGFAEAQRHYERAIELWGQVAEPEAVVGFDRAQLFDRAAEAAHLAGEDRRASALATSALETDGPAGEGGSRASEAPAVSGTPQDQAIDVARAVRYQRLGRYLWAAGDSFEAVKALEKAVRCVPSDADSVERASVEGAYAEVLRLAGRYRDSHQHAVAALGVARRVGARLEEAQILATMGFDLAYLGDSESGVSALERAQYIAEELGRPEDIGRSYLHRVELLSGPLNRLHEAAEIATQGFARVCELGLERTYGVALLAMVINTMFRLGRWPEADPFMVLAGAAKPTGAVAIELRLARAKLLVGRGEFAAAEDDLRAAETMAAGGMGPRFQAPLMTLQAGLDLWLGRAEHARDAVDRGILASVSGSDDVWLLAPLIWHGLRAQADLAARGRRQRQVAAVERALVLASGLAAQMENLASEPGDAAPAIRQAIDAYVYLCRGELARAERRDDADVWAEAARRWEQLHQPYPEAYARWREAEALFAERSRSARGTRVLRAAHRATMRLGAVPLGREVEALAQRARVSLAGSGATPAAPPPTPRGAPVAEEESESALDTSGVLARLSPRELEVWLLLPLGLTNREIGERLFISAKTASVHVTNVLRKLGVKSRVQAVTLAHQLGVVDAERRP
jgi:DNA-binding CsgD family transcriptional regulator/tetratricopeptide (TPR) repeat protein